MISENNKILFYYHTRNWFKFGPLLFNNILRIEKREENFYDHEFIKKQIFFNLHKLLKKIAF